MSVSGRRVEEEVATMENPPVHNMIRWISKSGITDDQRGFWSVNIVDEHVGAWINQGYKLFSTHFLGESPEAFGVLYILEKST